MYSIQGPGFMYSILHAKRSANDTNAAAAIKGLFYYLQTVQNSFYSERRVRRLGRHLIRSSLCSYQPFAKSFMTLAQLFPGGTLNCTEVSSRMFC